jgi:hypothetical protein
LTPYSEQRLFSESLYALLQYYKAGNTQAFYSIVDKALVYCVIKINEEQRKYLRRLLFDRLKIFGLLESYWNNGKRWWVVSGNCFISRDSNSAFVFGDLSFLATMKQVLNSKKWSTHELFILPRQTGANFSLSIDLVQATYEQVEEISKKFRCDLVSDAYLQLMQIVPPMDVVESQFISPCITVSDIQAEEVKKFNFDRCEWVEVSDVRSIGYYRVPHIYGQHRDYVVKRIANSLLGFEVTNREWSFLLASQILGTEINWRYAPRRSELLVPSKQISHIPALLKRALCVKAFHWPKLKSDHYIFEKISWKNITELNKKYPIIGVDNVT